MIMLFIACLVIARVFDSVDHDFDLQDVFEKQLKDVSPNTDVLLTDCKGVRVCSQYRDIVIML